MSEKLNLIGKPSKGDTAYKWIATIAAITILLLLAGVAIFLAMSSQNAFLSSAQTIESQVSFARGMGFWGFTGAALFGTVLASLIALVIAVPFAVGIALFISHYAPKRVGTVSGYVIDLLAAIPSVVFGLWGMWSLEPLMRPIFAGISSILTPIFEFLAGTKELVNGETVWSGGLPGLRYMAEHFAWWPIQPDAAAFTPPARNILMGGIILAIMILPIITSLTREVFLKTPRLQEEAAIGLGATRWEMIRMVVLPHGRSGIVSATMLGLGRALGETMALLMVLSPGLQINFNLLKPGQHSTIASQIALRFPEASGLSADFLVATGLVLFVVTFAVNFVARAIVARYSEFSGANA
ncbi:phosphate transport system permease protein [Arcanobacterium wilhelmae]|uniref:Phosphate transport system permease protein n=1 Tax=Arcanobacterium wilhelmae TaxID=1803177 RepID=A0ABT9NB67_9ACTO|nr:ABC transporter permease subunit [Arcanobacterium wilhelmae]MDP9800656.1 phosphate transport system permease protein [Arcanobacterium wilhelmae]WFN90059.1 ABC transporter permease subunit [Arcanobacterium wilhelmae]